MANLETLNIRVTDMEPVRRAIEALGEIAAMSEFDEGFDPRAMQRLAIEAIEGLGVEVTRAGEAG